MVILHIEADDKGKYTISADQDTSITEICFGISAMIKCFLREKLIKKPEEIYAFIKKYTEDTSMDLPVEDTEKAEQITMEEPADENPS